MADGQGEAAWGTSGQAHLEWWNAGIMQSWVNGKICVGDKIKMANTLLKTNLPVFHYSIIPFKPVIHFSFQMSS